MIAHDSLAERSVGACSSRRSGHFMPAALLDSQLQTLERPGEDERPIVVDVAAEPDAIVDTILASLVR